VRPSNIITLPGALTRQRRCSDHLTAQGHPHRFVMGIDADRFGIKAVHPYTHDGGNEPIRQHQLGCFLSHWVLWSQLDQEQNWHSIMEDDVILRPGWRRGLSEAMACLPKDWDILLLGSCNCGDKTKRQVAGPLWVVEGPMCTHWYIVRGSALPTLMTQQATIRAPVDISLGFHSYPHLNVYTALPRLADQHDTEIHD
jgi:GR25 family glycosyltransferase involved in LPS biosynthesis